MGQGRGLMNILAIAQVEDDTNLIKQLAKQTIQPYDFVRYIDKTPAQTIDERRKRIARNHKGLQAAVLKFEPDLVWQLEQDCILPEDTLERLLNSYHSLKGADFGYVSGVQVGRHGIYCIGAWHIGKGKVDSVDPKLTGIHKVDATGFYCLLSPAKVWLQGNAWWTEDSLETHPGGPDINWALSLKRKGYSIFVDMDLHIGHKVKRGEIWPSHASTCQVHFTKQNDKWNYKTT